MCHCVTIDWYLVFAYCTMLHCYILRRYSFFLLCPAFRILFNRSISYTLWECPDVGPGPFHSTIYSAGFRLTVPRDAFWLSAGALNCLSPNSPPLSRIYDIRLSLTHWASIVCLQCSTTHYKRKESARLPSISTTDIIHVN